MRPWLGRYNPTRSFTSVVLPAPDGPTKAIVWPRCTSNETSDSAGCVVVACVKLTPSKARVRRSSTATGSTGLGSMGIRKIASKFSSDASVSRNVFTTLPSSCIGPKMKKL